VFSCACYRDMYTKEPFYGYDKKERDSVIKAGYKQTELGVIPDDWEVKAVEEISDVRSGKRLPLGNSLTDKETPYPYIRVADMEIGTIVLDDIKYIPPDVYPCIKNYRIFEEDIFISVAGSLGIVGKIPSQLNGANLTENADRLTKISIDRDYLMYMLMSPLIQNTIESEKTLGAQPKLALIRIRQFNIPLPPTKTEQTAIAKALSDTDALIQSLSQLIAKKRQIKQGAMQTLLNPYDETGALKTGWVVKNLGDIFEITAGGDLRKSEFSNVQNENYSYPIYSNAHTKEGLYGYCQTYDYEGQVITISARGGIGYAVSRNHKFAAIGRLLILKPNQNTECRYVAEYINLKIEFANESTSVPQLTAPQVAKYKISLPQYKEQTKTAQILTDMDTEITTLETKLSKYQKIKQGMMQNLLTGRIRLV